MAKAQTQTGSKALRAKFEDAKSAIEEADALLLPDPDPHLLRNGVKAGQWEGAPFDRMPEGCPVQVVGRDADGAVYCITATGHMRKMEKWDMPALTDLFAPKLNSLMFYWPGWGTKKVTDAEGEEKKIHFINRVERDKAMMCLVNEAARKPDFDPNTQHRGRGGWEDSQDNFIWHSGGWLWRKSGNGLERSRPAQHDGFLYTRMAATIEPWAQPVSQEESPALRILQDIATWEWRRGYLDPIMVLGWIATALQGGALKARPIIFASGGAGVGKSRLHEVIRSALHGVVMTSVNTTAAGIYQRIKLDSLPFMVDELEAKAGTGRPESIIELARVAYTGGDISRGGQDHEATTFTARNSFFFSAIIPPPMGPQDKTRMAMLNLAPLKMAGKPAREMLLKPETDGRMLLRQVIDGWEVFNKELMPFYAEILGKQGLSARAIDTYGTLLAAAELLVGRMAMEDIGLPVGEDPAHLGAIIAEATAADRTEQMEHWQQCIDILFQSTIDQWREGVKPTVGKVCEDYRSDNIDLKFARERLELANVGLMPKGWLDPNIGPVLAVPFDGQHLRRIYADTDFYKGGWTTALMQAPAGITHSCGDKRVKINGMAKACRLIDLEALERFTTPKT